MPARLAVLAAALEAVAAAHDTAPTTLRPVARVTHAALATTVPFRALDVVSWPLPTHSVAKRDATVCGYIHGDPDLPATCSAGSHCVLDAVHSAVGCCPDASDSCTAGVFTACVDGAAEQADVDPYVYTCSAGRVCYKNDFGGGYYQYGCGSATTGASVAATASGKVPVRLTSENVPFTDEASLAVSSIESSQSASSQSASSQSQSQSSSSSQSSSPSSSPSSSQSSQSSSQSSSSSQSQSQSQSQSGLTSSSPSNTAAATATASHNAASPGSLANQDGTSSKKGVIIGATISGIAGLVALAALLVFCTRRRRRAAADTTTDFRALHSNPDDYETGLAPDMISAMPQPPSARAVAAGARYSADHSADHSAHHSDDNAKHSRDKAPSTHSVHSAHHSDHLPDDAWAIPTDHPAQSEKTALTAAAAGVGVAVTSPKAEAAPTMTPATPRTNANANANANRLSMVSRMSSSKSHYRQVSGGSASSKDGLARAASAATSDGGRHPVPPAAYHELSPYEPDDEPGAPYDPGVRADVLSRIGEEDEDMLRSLRTSLRTSVRTSLRNSIRSVRNTSGGVGGVGGAGGVGVGTSLRASYLQGPTADTADEPAGRDSPQLDRRRASEISTTISGSSVDGREYTSSGVLPPSQHPLRMDTDTDPDPTGGVEVGKLRGGGSSYAGSGGSRSVAASRSVSAGSADLADVPLHDNADADPDNTGSYAAIMASVLAKSTPLWQQNRTKARNLMWS